MIQPYINVILEVGMMLIGLIGMGSAFDDRPLGTIILLGIIWNLVHWGIMIHTLTGPDPDTLPGYPGGPA